MELGLPKINSNRDRKIRLGKLPWKVNGKSVFLLMQLSAKPKKKKKK